MNYPYLDIFYSNFPFDDCYQEKKSWNTVDVIILSSK